MIPQSINAFLSKYFGSSWKTTVCGLATYGFGFVNAFPALFHGKHSVSDFLIAFSAYAVAGTGLVLAKDHK